MPEGTGTFAVWTRNRFRICLNLIATVDRQIHMSHHGSFVRNWNCVMLLYRHVNRLYMLTAAEGR